MPHYLRESANNAIVDLCGVWNAWEDGLQIDKIKITHPHGCLLMHHVQLAEQSFVWQMFLQHSIEHKVISFYILLNSLTQNIFKKALALKSL